MITADSLVKKKTRAPSGQLALHVFFILACATYIVPFLLMVSISFSTEADIAMHGYSLLPRTWSLAAYKIALANPEKILRAYGVTITYSVISCVLVVLVNTLMAYPMSRPNCSFNGALTLLMTVTMFISGGMVANFIVYTRMYHLGNTLWIYILPGIASTWNIIIIRTFFKGLPEGLVEAAKIDGASEWRICFQICIPLCVPCMATIAFMNLVGKWNDWNTSQLYITNQSLYSLQYLLQRILREMEFIKSMSAENAAMAAQLDTVQFPTETVRYALAILVSGPILVVFPFFQKYFAKGITVGSLKG